MHHRSPAGTVTRVPGRCLHWSPTPPGPRWPPAYRCILIEVLHLYRCVTHTHLTHNLSPHNVFTLTLPHTNCSTPILHHLFSLSFFPHAIFTFLLLLVGRSWHVGLSGPLISRSYIWLRSRCADGGVFHSLRFLISSLLQLLHRFHLLQLMSNVGASVASGSQPHIGKRQTSKRLLKHLQAWPPCMCRRTRRRSWCSFRRRRRCCPGHSLGGTYSQPPGNIFRFDPAGRQRKSGMNGGPMDWGTDRASAWDEVILLRWLLLCGVLFWYQCCYITGLLASCSKWSSVLKGWESFSVTVFWRSSAETAGCVSAARCVWGRRVMWMKWFWWLSQLCDFVQLHRRQWWQCDNLLL